MLFGDAGKCRRVVGLAVALIALACALILPAVASAGQYEVDSLGDEPDVVHGDELCATAAPKCTLRAALEEANSEPGEDEIRFSKKEGLFGEELTGTISIGESLSILHPVNIEGECVIGDSGVRPCVEVSGPGPTEPALIVEKAREVKVRGLAFTGSGTGIEVLDSPEFKAIADWFGVGLDGAANGNGTGILLGPGSDLAKIGNGGFINVFANNTAVGLDVFGASSATVIGNYFGVAPDGATPAANGEDIEVTGGNSAASGTMIGAQEGLQEGATPACDGGCNVISGSSSNGIDLEGDGGAEVPATGTSIIGNYVGLDASGTLEVPNELDGVHVGSARHTAVGGPRESEENRFVGGQVAVSAAPGADRLAIRGNSIGFDAQGSSSAAPAFGIVVTAEAGAGSSGEATILDNEIEMHGGVAITQRGFGGWITGNKISGAEIGISTSLSVEEHGNLIEGNLIEGSARNAILLENELNEVRGNELLDSGEAGVLVSGEPPFGVSGNRIGGDSAATENLISGSGGPAVRILNDEESETVVGRNRGSGNGGPFIDLVSLDPIAEPKGPNGGLSPPGFEGAFTDVAFGNAKEGARVRLFRKAGASPGELESFLGEAVADEDGLWEVEFAAPMPAGTYLAATQTVEGRRTSELGIAATPAAPSVPGAACPPASCAAPLPQDVTPPQTAILKHPKKKSSKTTAGFKFSADEAGARFECKLDKKKFKACKSPKKYKHLKPGKHVFKVRAIDPSGNVETTPAKFQFTVLG